MQQKEGPQILERHVNSSFTLPWCMFEEMESTRWKMKLTRSEFVRLAIKLFIETNEIEG